MITIKGFRTINGKMDANTAKQLSEQCGGSLLKKYAERHGTKIRFRKDKPKIEDKPKKKTIKKAKKKKSTKRKSKKK